MVRPGQQIGGPVSTLLTLSVPEGIRSQTNQSLRLPFCCHLSQQAVEIRQTSVLRCHIGQCQNRFHPPPSGGGSGGIRTGHGLTVTGNGQSVGSRFLGEYTLYPLLCLRDIV